MKTTLTILAAAMAALPAMAQTAPADSFDGLSPLSKERFSGAFSVGYDSNYCGRGIVMSHAVVEGDSEEFVALKLKYDFGRKSYWSVENTLSYRIASSGHTLYGNPDASMATKMAVAAQKVGMPVAQLQAAYNAGMLPPELKAALDSPQKIKQCNIENEFAVNTAVRYDREKWNIAFGHTFVHGGILGVMAKHYRDQGASCTNEVFITPAWTPTKWLDAGVTTRFSFQGITGWWFEPYVTFKAPVIGDAENVKMAAVLTFALSATAEYFNEGYFACSNGTQAFWIKLQTPYFVKDNFILAPYVSFNWLGKGALKANEESEFRKLSGDASNVPFRNFGVVAGVSATYTF